MTDKINDDIEAEVERTRKVLANLYRVAGISRADADRILDLPAGTARRILGGKVELRQAHILLFLIPLRIEPEEFYAVLYPPRAEGRRATLPSLLERLAWRQHLTEKEKRAAREVTKHLVPSEQFDFQAFARQMAAEVLQSLREQAAAAPAGESAPLGRAEKDPPPKPGAE